MLRFIRRPRFVVSATIALLVAAFVTYRATRPTSYQVYERVRVGDGIEEVTRRLGEPTDSHQTTNGTDYLFAVTGHPDYPRMLGVPFPVHRIIRVQNGRVIAKGAYEDYYNPYAPGWVPKQEEVTK